MADLALLRQKAQSAPAVVVDSVTLLALLDAAASGSAKAKPAREVRQSTEDDERCARWLFSVLQRSNESAKAPNFATWANDIRLLRERDERTHHEICELFRWAQQDAFWCTNILSPKKLREKWDQLVMRRRQVTVTKQVAQLGKQGQATAQNAQKWLEEHSNAA